jgi:MFS transporter, DHA3 family, macrolide efflux protein
MPANPGRMVFAGNLVLGVGMMGMALVAAAPFSPGLTTLGFAAGACVGAAGGPMHDIPVAVLRQTELARGDIPAAIRASLVVNNVGLLVAMAVAPVGYAMLPVSAVMGMCAAVIMAIGAVGVGRFHPHPGRWRAPTSPA